MLLLLALLFRVFVYCVGVVGMCYYDVVTMCVAGCSFGVAVVIVCVVVSCCCGGIHMALSFPLLLLW